MRVARMRVAPTALTSLPAGLAARALSASALVALTLSASALAAVTLAVSASPALAVQSSSIAGFQFEPTPLTVTVGETVTWTNKDAVAHTVTASGKQFDSGKLAAGKSFSFTFKSAGTYLYTCTLHPYMKGEVIVQGMSAMSMPMPMPEAKPPAPMPSPPATPITHAGVTVHLSHRSHRRTSISVSSAHPGARVLLQLYSREHFSWLQVAHTTLDAQGHATLKLKAAVRRPLRVIVVDEATGTTLTSATRRS